MFRVQQRDKENMKGTLLDYISMLTFGFAEETCVLMWKRLRGKIGCCFGICGRDEWVLTNTNNYFSYHDGNIRAAVARVPFEVLQTKVTAGVSPIDRNGHPRSQGLFPTQFSQFQLALTTLNNSNSNIAAQNSSRVNSCLLLDA